MEHLFFFTGMGSFASVFTDNTEVLCLTSDQE